MNMLFLASQLHRLDSCSKLPGQQKTSLAVEVVGNCSDDVSYIFWGYFLYALQSELRYPTFWKKGNHFLKDVLGMEKNNFWIVPRMVFHSASPFRKNQENQLTKKNKK